MPDKTILAAIPPQLVGRGHNRCVPMKCGCGAVLLFALSDGTEEALAPLDQIDIRCPVCLGVTSEPTAALLDPANIFNGQSGEKVPQ